MVMHKGPFSSAAEAARRRPLGTALLILGGASTLAADAPPVAVVVALSTVPLAVLLYRGARNGWVDRDLPGTYLLSLVPGPIVAVLGASIPGAPVGAQVVWGIAALTVAWWIKQMRHKTANLAPVVLWLLTIIGVVAVVASFSDMVIDVWFLHRDASANILAGVSPYSGLAVDNGSPTAAPDDIIVGYPYPLVALLPFLAAFAAGFDPRAGLAVVWILISTVILFWSAFRRRSRMAPAVALVLAAATPLNLWAAWTEPVTVLWMVLAGVGWVSPVIGPLALGIGLASKQYMVALAPLLLSRLLAGRRRWLVVVAIVAGLGSGLLLDPRGFIDNAIMFHLAQPHRPDSLNVTGILTALGWSPPGIGLLAILAGMWTAWKLRTHVDSLADWMRAAAATLAVTFMLSPQAFSNYWFLVLCLVLLSELIDEEPTPISP